MHQMLATRRIPRPSGSHAGPGVSNAQGSPLAGGVVVSSEKRTGSPESGTYAPRGHAFESIPVRAEAAPARRPLSPLGGANRPIQRLPSWRKVLGGIGAVGGTLAAGAGAVLGGTALAAGTLTAGTGLLAASLVGGGAYAAYKGGQALLGGGKSRKRRPKKPTGLRDEDSRGNTLTAHHKLPLNMIKATTKEAEENKEARERLDAWSDRARRGGELGKKGEAWTRHNIFMGPLVENRHGDPGENVDTHFTKSGTVTPKSELALDVAASGGIHKFDADELRRRLEKLQNPDQESGYESEEWEGPDDARRQVGEPKNWQALSIPEKVKYATARRQAKENPKKKSGKKKAKHL
ncbi:MAG TPA: hypothetical protein VN783_16750 [Thermoanaerobaculia bacterium]|nr:hypothetical protein [Thermoanaerobaculia bacterium]